MDTKPAKPGPWFADDNQDTNPTPGTPEPKADPTRGGKEVKPASATVDEDDGAKTDPGPKSDRSGNVKG